MSAKTTKTVTPAAATTAATTPAKKDVKPAAAPAAAAVPAAAAPAAPVKKVVKKTEEAPVATPVAEKKVEAAPISAVESPAAPAPAVEVSVSAAAPAVESGALGSVSEEKLKVLSAKIAELSNALKEAANEMKLLQRQVSKDFKEATKASRSRRGRRQPVVVGGVEKAKRSPSGFAKPTGLTDALCTFLGLPSGSLLARTEVTKKITEYIKTHNLQNPANKKIIIPDATLSALLDNGSSEVTYFNLQKFLKVHFLKSETVAVAVAVVV